jgi:hypothetical protein
MPIGFLGLPSLHSIIEAIANGFFGALASALVPGFLKHGTIATIQHLVALPDPGTWGHVHQLQADMTYLATMLMPVTLAVGTVRYWLVGLTGQAHPATAVTRTVWVTGVLVAYGWIVGQAVAATNTVTHAILGFPTVADGLQRIIGVLFGGALLAGAGGVFGAFLVIVGVLFAAGLFAAQVLLTVVLALLIVTGPPAIALSAIPELSHLARGWAHALLATALVPLGWTILFATAGALCLDATSFTGGATGLPGHVAAAFAGLITFVLAVKLPWMLFGELRRQFTASSLTRHGGTASAPSSAPGVERVRAAHARLRSTAFEGVPSLGRSVGRAARAMGAPAGGPLGAARRGLAGAALRTGILPATAAAGFAGAAVGRGKPKGSERPGVRERLARAGAILRDAPRDATVTMARSSPATKRARSTAGARRFSTPRSGEPAKSRPGPGTSAGKQDLSDGAAAVQPRRTTPRPQANKTADQDQLPAQLGSQRGVRSTPALKPTAPEPPPRPRTTSPAGNPGGPSSRAPDTAHPGREVTSTPSREAAEPSRPNTKPSTPPPASRSDRPPPPPQPWQPPTPADDRPRPRRTPRPRPEP